MSYASLEEAKEAIGGHVRCVLELTLTDKAGNRPTGDWWTEAKTLHLCGGEPFLRTDSAGAEGFIYYEALVKSWGVISQECQIGQAFGSIADTQIILHNRKIAAQQNNSTYAFGAGSPGMDPEPIMVQLAEMFHFYNFLSATVVIKVFFFSGADTDQGTAANFESRTIFNGFIQDVDIGSDITLDITQDTTMQETILPGRLLSDSIDAQVKTTRAPIVYGNFWEHFTSTGTADEINGLTMYNAIRAGLFKPTMVNALPWKRDADHETGANNRLMYIYNDVKGRNDGWIGQDGYSGRENLNNGPWIYHSQGDVWTLLDTSSGSPSSGFIDWPNWAGDMEEALVNQEDYLKGDVSIPCESVYDEGDISLGSATTLINPENLFDGDPFTYAELPIDNDNYVDLRIRQVSPLGSMAHEDDAMRAYIVVDTSTVTGAPAPSVRFGIFRPADASAPVTHYKFWGQGDNDSAYGDDVATYGDLDSGSGSFTKGYYDQGALNDVDIGVEHYYGNTPFPPANWDWKLAERAEDHAGTEWSYSEMVVRIEVENQGGAGETLKIIGAGIAITHFPVKEPTKIPDRPAAGFERYRVNPIVTRTFPNWAVPRHDQPATQNLWICLADNTLDRTTPEVLLTANSDGPIDYPCDIAAHLLLKWGDGVASADVDVDESAVSQGSPFGSGHYADLEINTWRLGGTTLDSQLVINQETTMGQELDAFMAQFPAMLYREVGDDKVYFCFYPEDTTDTNRYYSGSSPIKFHPNIDHPDADNYGKPYVVQDVKIKTTPLGEIFNRFTLRYRGYGPHGLTQKFTVTETPNDSNVLDTSTNRNNAKTNSAPGGYDPSAVCATSQERYGVKQWLNIDAPGLHSHDMAYAFMHYLLKRFTQPRVIAEATCGPEAVDLKPGHIISFADDLNLLYPIPDYGSGAAKVTGWAFTGGVGDPHKDFLVHRITRRPQDYGCETTFQAEQVMFNPRGAFWDVTDISTGTVAEHLHTDDITGLSDGDAVGGTSDWTARVGTDGSQSTAARRPTYESAPGDLQNGYPIVSYANSAGSDDALIITGYTAPTGNYVMAFVCNLKDVTTATQTLYRSETTGPVVEINTSSQLIVADGGGSATIGTVATGKQTIVVKADSTDGIEVWVNGVSIGTDGTYTSQTPAAAQIIGNRHLWDRGVDWDLYEFIVINYSGAVDDDEVSKLIGHLHHEWGVEGELAANHIYRYAPPTM